MSKDTYMISGRQPKTGDATAANQTAIISTNNLPALSQGAQVMGKYDSTVPTAVDDGDATALLTDSYGRLRIITNDLQTPNGDSLVDDTNDVVKISVNVALPAGDNNIGNVDVVTSALPTGAATVANQLPDGHNVTIDNSTGAAAVNIQDGGNSITIDGTVTANLGATDNAVLDSIDTAVTSKYITGIGHGVKTVTTAGTDVALAGSTACKRVTIQAQTDNTGWIAVGATGVDATEATGTGALLGAGDAFELEIDNLADVFIDSTVNGEGVRYTYFT